MAGGEFEDKSLAALYSMVASADPKALTSRGDALGKAGSDMDEIGGELRAYVERVEWKGEGGDAFREWGQQFALETMRFAMYARTLGNHMMNAGQALTEAKAAVPPPEMCYADPEEDKARREREEEKRQEAINQLNRLSSYYRAAGESIRGEPEPEFRPLPEGRQPEIPGTNAPSTGAGGGSGEPTVYRESGVTSDRPTSARGEAGGHPVLVTDRSIPMAERPSPVTERPTHMTIDSTAPLPVAEARPQVANPAPSQSSAGPSVPSVAPMAPTTPVQRIGQTPSRAPVTGRPPVVGGGGVPPRGHGVIGGTPRQVGGPATGIPRGTVAGGDHTAPGRPVGGQPGATGSGTPANRGMPPGRPMSSQPGGTVGGPRTGGSHGRAFTPGGTGLVRGGAATPGTAARPANANPPPENRRRGNDRPDYLTEDEETWASGRRNVVPPVID